jgi:hypothetical protein
MSNFHSVLSDVGSALKRVFNVGVNVATAAEPFVDVLFPGVAPLFNAIVAEVTKAEAEAMAAGAQNGTGPQKLAAVTAAVEGAFNNYAKTNNLATPDAKVVENAVNAVVAFLNALPAPATPAAAPAPTPAKP